MTRKRVTSRLTNSLTTSRRYQVRLSGLRMHLRASHGVGSNGVLINYRHDNMTRDTRCLQ